MLCKLAFSTELLMTKYTFKRYFVGNYVSITAIFWADSTVRMFEYFMFVKNPIILTFLLWLKSMIMI